MHTEPELSAASTPQPGHYDIDPGRPGVTFRDRTEFGITAARGLAARYLDLTVEIQCSRN